MSKKYNEEDKTRAVAHYLVTGNIVETAKSINIPRRTIQDWRHQDWFITKLNAAREEYDEQLDALMTVNIRLANEELRDRIKDGDYRLNKKDELVRVPMSGRDLSVSGAVTYDKRALLRGQPTSIQRNDSNAHLQELLETFERISTGKVIDGEVIK